MLSECSCIMSQSRALSLCASIAPLCKFTPILSMIMEKNKPLHVDWSSLCCSLIYYIPLSLFRSTSHFSLSKYNVASLWEWPCSLYSANLPSVIDSSLFSHVGHILCTLCPLCCKHKVIVCSFTESIFYVNVVYLAQGSPRIGASGTCWRMSSVIPDRVEVVCFVHMHLAQVLLLASSTSAVAVVVQQNGFYLGMNNHCFHVICFVYVPLLTPYTLNSWTGRPARVPCLFLKIEGNKKHWSCDEKPPKHYRVWIISHRELVK